ncbi:actin cortical patch SUR7/pH-response regulator pali [Boeremia exigua]|uniref:actin cortical patch SUR7/pH-response regulator pali n=1 Tax=Boeremia exigua TaxID=749465 RepID=UPI001E8DAD5D|nr:actin cortical patch SUR7/pH-response regulator pali [Boeremia exigua]KAH6638176.1 actin cortical patch SUR7/pH-response regulator pali [Boeremia exigua]
MRFTALLPVLCCTVALILSFLCLFAGHKKDFMEDYHLISLNTSMIGETIINETRSTDTSNPITNLLNSISNTGSEIVNDAIGEVTQRLGIEDFYSAHMLNYCEGQYTPAEAPNATVSESDISKNVTECSKNRAMYKFDPTQIIEDALNRTTGLDVTLDDLNWPEDIDTGIKTLNALMGAMFVLYCIAIALIFVALLAAAAAVLLSGRLSACVNFLISVLAFLSIGLASALVTAVIVKASNIINDKGNEIGLVAHYGGKFLALTWAATGLMLVVVLTWVVEFCIGRRHNKQPTYAKHG